MGKEAAGTDIFAASSTKRQPYRTHCSEDTGKSLQCPFSSGQPEHTFDHADAWCLSLLSLEHRERWSPCYRQVQLLDGVPTPVTLTIDGSQDDTRVVIGYHVCIAVFRFIHFQVGVLPGELLPGINGLWRERERSC